MVTQASGTPSENPPNDPIGESLRDFVGELLSNAIVELVHTPVGDDPACRIAESADTVVASASEELVPGWTTTLAVGFGAKATSAVASVPDTLLALPAAALRAGQRFAGAADPAAALGPAFDRALRDTVIVELLGHHQVRSLDPGAAAGGGGAGADSTGSDDSDGTGDTDDTVACASTALLADTLEYLIELSGTRVEAHNLTHGVIITDAIAHEPRLKVPYPSGLRDAKRSPLLFDGRRSVLVVDRAGRARTELQAHRLDRLHPSSPSLLPVEREFVDSGSLVALATRQLGGIGFFLREDRSIWTFVEGQPLVVRRGEHWTAFPLWLARAIGERIGGGAAVELIVSAALLVSVKTGGAIFAIVDDRAELDGIVAPKDRFDLRNEVGPDTDAGTELATGDDRGDAMRSETKLHHLIDAGDLDAQTLARLAELDGATVLDRDGSLLAYGAIISSSDSQHEGARTAAAKSLSLRALIVLKVSEDGDITVFRDGEAVATLLPTGLGR